MILQLTWPNGRTDYAELFTPGLFVCERFVRVLDEIVLVDKRGASSHWYMQLGRPFKPGEAVRCKCPDGVCSLPNGLEADRPARVIATYFEKTYVLFDGKSYLVPNACVHRADLQRFVASDC